MTSFPTSIKIGPIEALVMIELGPLMHFLLCYLIFLDEWSHIYIILRHSGYAFGSNGQGVDT